jgi:DHA1 family bicyclomycin/chloramphenicol resistance-like MFS transporter
VPTRDGRGVFPPVEEEVPLVSARSLAESGTATDPVSADDTTTPVTLHPVHGTTGDEAPAPAGRDAAAPQAGEALSTAARARLVLVLGSLIALGPLTIDMYLPALPAITDDLLTTASAVQLTLTGTLLGLGVGQLLVGPWSDAVGRRRPLVAGVALHIVASLLCLLAPNVAVLGAFRVLQGLGVAAAMVVAMAIVRDLFVGTDAARLISRLMLVMGAAPILAPTLGSEILRLTDWRGIFAGLAALGVVLLAVAVLALPETLPPERRHRTGVAGSLRAYAGLFRDRTFVGLIVVSGLTMATLFAYVSGSSFVLQDVYGLDEQAFGYVFGAGAAGLIAGTQLNARLLRRWTPEQVLSVSVAAAGLSAVALVAVAATGAGGLPGLLVPLWLVLTFCGVSLPNTGALALTLHGEAAGTAAALLGALQFAVGALAAPLVGVLGTTSALPMAAVMGGAALAAAAVMLLVVRPRQVVDDGPIEEVAVAA